MSDSKNAIILDDRAHALASYPHARRVNNLVFISGISSRRPDNSHDGVEIADDGSVRLSIKEQTRAVLNNIDVIARKAGGSIKDLVDVTVFLVNMNDYKGMNSVYNEFFDAQTGPARTTVAVHQLPHPHLLVEIKAIMELNQ